MKVMTNTKWEASRFKRELTCQSSVTYENNKPLINNLKEEVTATCAHGEIKMTV